MITINFIRLFFAVFFMSFYLLVGCNEQEARRPISRSYGSLMKESADRNKQLIAEEEALIDSIIKKNTEIQYFPSKKGYWYYYEKKETDLMGKIPVRGDVVFFDFEIKDLSGNLIYSPEELKPQIYYIDKENIIMGLRDGIKLMKKGEKMTFLFPSHMAYGYHGDDNRIRPNQPLICTVTLNDIKKEKEIKQ